MEARLIMLGQHRKYWGLGETRSLEATEMEGATDDRGGSLGGMTNVVTVPSCG